MRALLVVNPKATATTARGRDVLARALSSELKLEVAETVRRGHAIELGRQAREDALDLVVALGGDGTVNEVVNGMLTAGPGTEVPALGVVPGGSTNVFSRSLGLPRDPVEAMSDLLDRLRDGRRRWIGLGTADDRYFTFCAGLGLDAEVVRAVEGRRHDGRRSTPSLYVRTALQHFYTGTDRRRPALTLRRPGHDDVDHIFFGFVSNTAPWTYLGPRPVNPTPLASFDAGLDLMALRKLRTTTTLRHVRQILAGNGRVPRGKHVLALHDVDEFTLSADRPMAFQVDGDYLGEREQLTFRAVPRALSVIA